MMELVDEAEGAVAQAAARGVGQLAHGLAGHEHLARRGHIQPAQQVQQGALAGAGGADDGHGLAARDLTGRCRANTGVLRPPSA